MDKFQDNYSKRMRQQIEESSRSMKDQMEVNFRSLMKQINENSKQKKIS